jgi:hypothetical protein
VRGACSLLLVALLCLVSARALTETSAPVDAPPTVRAPPRAAPSATPGKETAATNCAACHVESSWSEVRFNHDRTGYPLAGAHAKVTCQACHPTGFRARVSELCSGCHRDRHAGEFGLHCEGCHEATRWAEALFGPDAHRSTAFPLTGRHALIPCRECHGDMRDRTFSQTPLACVACHRKDYDNAALTSLDHAASHFDTNCQACHNTWSYFPARFDAHERCFVLSSGPHAPIRCAQCHTRAAGLVVTGACSTQNTTCTSCHAHSCARSDQEHQSVINYGYSCNDTKCYQCHLRSVP